MDFLVYFVFRSRVLCHCSNVSTFAFASFLSIHLRCHFHRFSDNPFCGTPSGFNVNIVGSPPSPHYSLEPLNSSRKHAFKSLECLHSSLWSDDSCDKKQSEIYIYFKVTTYWKSFDSCQKTTPINYKVIKHSHVNYKSQDELVIIPSRKRFDKWKIS